MPGRLYKYRLELARLQRQQRSIAARKKRQQPVDRLIAQTKGTEREIAGWLEQREFVAPIIEYPEQLPVAAASAMLIAAMREHQVIVVTGETGSGKTTQLPKMLWEAGCGRTGVIACTQPRRLAAIAVAARLQEEMACQEPVVTHAVRFR